ncbi:MAG: hypothetical protein V7K92_06535 [Nostoc sp.]
MSEDALALSEDALALQGIAEFNSLGIYNLRTVTKLRHCVRVACLQGIRNDSERKSVS